MSTAVQFLVIFSKTGGQQETVDQCNDSDSWSSAVLEDKSNCAGLKVHDNKIRWQSVNIQAPVNAG